MICQLVVFKILSKTGLVVPNSGKSTPQKQLNIDTPYAPILYPPQQYTPLKQQPPITVAPLEVKFMNKSQPRKIAHPPQENSYKMFDIRGFKNGRFFFLVFCVDYKQIRGKNGAQSLSFGIIKKMCGLQWRHHIKKLKKIVQKKKNSV